MSFTIVAAYSDNYAHILDYSLPSWEKNSGAERMILKQLDVERGPRHTAWYDGSTARCHSLARNVIAELEAGRHVVTLDVDCIVLRNIEGGFLEGCPISVARWPDFNMGVMFYRADTEHDLTDLLLRTVGRIERVNNRYRGRLREAGGCFIADQTIWQEELHESPHIPIGKLDAGEWNFCPLPKDLDREWAKYQDRVRIVHLKGQGQPHRHEQLKRLLAEKYGDRI